jgi:hypothetical protein
MGPLSSLNLFSEVSLISSGHGYPGCDGRELAAQLTPYRGGENGGPADNAQPPVHRQGRDDRLRLYQRT